MSVIRVASRYAKSLLELAVERGDLESVHRDIIRLGELGKENPEFKLLLQSPIINSDKKLKVIKALFPGEISPITTAFFEIVSRKGRENTLLTTAKEFHRQYNVQKGIQEAKVITTFPIGDELRQSFVDIAKEVSGKDIIELSEKVDEELIGGYVLTVGDKQIDESLSSKLNKLKLKFTQNLYEKKY